MRTVIKGYFCTLTSLLFLICGLTSYRRSVTNRSKGDVGGFEVKIEVGSFPKNDSLTPLKSLSVSIVIKGKSKNKVKIQKKVW